MTQEIVAELNTKNLSDEFIIMKNQSSQNIVSEKETEVVNRGKSAEVAVNSTLSLVYQGTSLRIISFYDIDGAVGL